MSYVSNEVELEEGEVEIVEGLYQQAKRVARNLWGITKETGEAYTEGLVHNKYILNKSDFPVEMHGKLEIVEHKVKLLFNDIFMLNSSVSDYEAHDMESKIAIEKEFDISVEYRGSFSTSVVAKSEEQAIEKFQEDFHPEHFRDELVDNAELEEVYPE